MFRTIFMMLLLSSTASTLCMQGTDWIVTGTGGGIASGHDTTTTTQTTETTPSGK